MASSDDSQASRTALRASLVLTLSSAVVVVMGIVRQKGLALAFGPEGVGLLGQLTTFVALAATVAGVGLGSSGVRSIAIARAASPLRLRRTASALLYASHALGVAGALLVLLPYVPLASALSASLPDGVRAWLPWCAVGVWAGVASAGHLALVNGLQRLRAFAAVNAASAVLSTAATLALIPQGRTAALAVALVGPGLFNLLGAVLAGRTPALPPRAARLWGPALKELLLVGATFMAGMLVGTGMQFAARLVVGATMGEEAAGWFHASWSIAGTYLTFLLSALGAEYFPRISAQASDPAALGGAVVRQSALVVHAVVPAVLMAIVFAPLVVRLLYDARFAPMTGMLRWQLAGDIFKVIGWAMSYALLARRMQRAFVLAEVVFALIYLGGLAWVVPQAGLAWAGGFYVLCYALYTAFVLGALRREVPLVGVGGVAAAAALYTAAALLVSELCAHPRLDVRAAGWGVAAAASVYAVRRVQHLTGLSWRTLGRRLRRTGT